MKLRVEFEPVSELSALSQLRDEYLDSLGQAQELSIELMIPGAAWFWIVDQGTRCGYYVVHERETLIEFWLREPYWVFGQCVFDQILAETAVHKALVKSFDHLLFSSCVAQHKTLVTKGMLVRDIVPRDAAEEPSVPIESRIAQLADLPAILAIDQPVFRHPERLRAVVLAGALYVFESESRMIGFCIARPVIAGRKHVELGIAVDKPYRQQGYAFQMFRTMIDICLARGLEPVSGAAVENIASRSMGERAGMVARYRLLELSF